MQRKMTAGVLAVLALLALWPTLGVGEEGEPSQTYSLLGSVVGVALPWGSGRDGDDRAFIVAVVVAVLVFGIVGWLPLPRSPKQAAERTAAPRRSN